MLIHKDNCVVTSMEDDPNYMIDEVIPEYRYKLKGF